MRAYGDHPFGLVDAGVVPDDTSAHVVEHVYRPPRVEGWDGLALIIEEVIGEEP